MMKLKRLLIVSLFVLAILTIGAVSASDENIASDDLVASEDLNLESFSDVADEPLSAGEALSTTPKTFTDLNSLINDNNESVIYLNSNYTYDSNEDSVFESGVAVGRGVTVHGNGFTISGNGGARIFNVTDSNVVFRDIIFINGQTNMNGGAIAGKCTAINCTFNNNTAAERGGAMYNGAAYNCTFNNNHAKRAGAIYNGESYNCIFNNNDRAEYGGALYWGAAYNSTFNGNNASISGGAIYDGKAYNCTFNNNVAKYGGAMYKGTVYDSIFIRNQAQNGGALRESVAHNCTFNNNYADNGGAMYKGTVYDSIFIRNQAKNGGALREGVARNCILNNNHADSGGSMYKGTAYNCTFINAPAEFKNAAYNVANTDCTFICDVEMTVEFPSSVSVYLPYTIEAYFNESISGTLTLLVDGKELDSDISYFTIYLEEYANKLKKLSPGTHSWELKFTLDDSDYTISKNGTFEYSYAEIYFPQYVIPWDDNGEFGLEMPSDAGGYITLYIDGVYKSKTKFKYDSEGSAIKIPKVSYGNHTYTVVHSGSSKYPGFKKSGSFYYTFMKAGCDDENIRLGESTTIDIEFPKDITGKVNIIANNKTYTYAAKKVMSCRLDDFTIGVNNITVRYLGSAKYPAVESKIILDAWTQIELPDSVAYCDQLVASLIMPKDAQGKLLAILDGEVVNESGFIDGKASVKFPLLPIKRGDFDSLGSYDVVVRYNGTDYTSSDGGYSGLEKSSEVTVGPKVILPDAKNKYFYIQFPNDAKGNVTVSVGGDYERRHSKYSKTFETTVSLKDGKAKVDLSKYLSDYRYRNYYAGSDYGFGKDYLIGFYCESNYPFSSGSFDVTIPKPIPTVKVKAPSTVFAGKSAKIEFTLPSDANGRMHVWDPSGNVVKVSKGKASITLKFNTKGTKTLSYDYGDMKYGVAEGTFKIVVLPLGKITAKDASVAYSGNSNYKVKVLDKKGKPVSSGVSVVFKINGKTVKKAKTDKKGYATCKITKNPGNYKITVQALGDVVTKKLTVKHVVAIKDVTVKRSSKKLSLQATLSKVNGKYLAKKTVTFKINGKKVATAKTNSKGVAKVTVNTPDVVKNLEEGKTVTYQATYLKDTVKKTIKIKK